LKSDRKSFFATTYEHENKKQGNKNFVELHIGIENILGNIV
jgi:hypothetical protein